MIEVVTLPEVKAHLHIDHDFDDADLKLKIAGASAAILDHVRAWLAGFDDEASIKASPDFQRVKNAVLILVGILDRDRDGIDPQLYRQGELPYTVTALIATLHRPVIL